MRRIVRISTSLAIVLVAYWAYALVLVPQIEPPSAPRSESASAAALLPIDRLAGLREMFQPGDWEVDERTKILESDQFKLLVQEYVNLQASSTMELRPCTIIYTPNGASANEAERNRSAVVLQAPGGATLQFDQPFDLRKGSIGRLVAGQLNGRITIRSEGKDPGPEDDLWAVTNDIQVTEERIWVPHPIEFTLGRHSGRGSEMQVTFVPGDPVGVRGRHGLNIAGVDSLEVRRLERLHLEPPSPRASKAQPSRPGGPPAENSDLPIDIRCRGPFRFDLGQQMATFEDQVDVVRIHPQGPGDQINCEILAIQFARRREEAAVPPGDLANATSKAPPGLPDLQVRRIEARGNPVIVRAPSQEVEARGERLEYDLQDRRIELDGAQPVWLKQGRNEVRARSLEYRLAGSGRLGEATATGPGWLRGQWGDRAGLPLEAVWKGQLLVRPDQHHQHVISLLDGAELKYAMLGHLSAAEIHFWVTEVASEASGPDRAPRLAVHPDRMLARRQVQLQAAQVSGAVNQLEIWFEAPARTALHMASAEVGQAGFKALPGVSPRVETIGPYVQAPGRGGGAVAPAFEQMVSPPEAGSSAPLAPPPATLAIGRHFHVEGGLLRARVMVLGERAEVADLIIEGNVRVAETRTAQPGEKPLAVTGDRVHVIDAAQPHAAVNVTGSPAHFEGRGLALEGANINLNAGTNRMWIDGPGSLRVTVDRDLEGRPTANPGVLVIHWQERMSLDENGRTIRFQESVVAAMGEDHLRSDTLEATFREPIRLADSKQQARPEIETIVCRGRTLLESRETDASGLIATQHIEAGDLMIDRQSGAIRAAGPGRVTSVRRNSPELPSVVPQALGPAPAGGAHQKPPLVYLDIRFQREITGNLQIRQMVFHEQVRVIYAPVASWDAALKDDDPEALGPDGVVLRCGRLSATQIPVPGTRARAWGLEATGNTVAEGQSFTARAVRMTYDQSKGLLVLEGDGRADAALYLHERPGERPKTQQFRRMLFWPATKRIEVDDFRSLEIPSLPGGRAGPR